MVLRHKMLAFPLLTLEPPITFTFCQSHEQLTFKQLIAQFMMGSIYLRRFGKKQSII